MPIYKVIRGVIEVEGQHMLWQPIETLELADGNHLISHKDLEVPVTIAGNSVIVHVDEAKGRLDLGTIDGTGDDWTFLDRGPISQVILNLLEDQVALEVFGEEDGHNTLQLECHDQAPEAFDFARRK